MGLVRFAPAPQLPVAGGPVVSGQWLVASGQWPVVSARMTDDKARRPSWDLLGNLPASSLWALATDHWPLTTLHRPLSTGHCPPPTPTPAPRPAHARPGRHCTARGCPRKLAREPGSPTPGAGAGRASRSAADTGRNG